MPRAVDRLIAGGALVVFAGVIVVVTAFSEVPVDPVTVRDDPYAYARVLVLARAGDATSTEVEYEFERAGGDRVETSTVTVARTPDGSATWTATAATLRRGNREWRCFDVGERRQCPETTDRDSLNLGSPSAFVTAAASGRYRIATLAATRIAGRTAECFMAELIGNEAIAGLGARLELCFATDGVLLSVLRVGPMSIDEQVAVRVEAIDGDDLSRRFDELSDGMVALSP